MANEIRMDASLTVEATNLRESYQPGSISIDLASGKGDGGVQEISHSGTAAQGEAISVVDVSLGGMFFVRNTDETNFVEIGVQASSTFFPFLKLLPGEFTVGRLGTVAPFARADTGNVDIQYRILSP